MRRWAESIAHTPKQYERLTFPLAWWSDNTFWMKGYPPWWSQCTQNMFCRQCQNRSSLPQTHFLNRHQWFLGIRPLWSWSLFLRKIKRAKQHLCWNHLLRWQRVHPVLGSHSILATFLYVIVSQFCLSHCRSYQIHLCFWSSGWSPPSAQCISQCKYPWVHSRTRRAANSDGVFWYSRKVLRWHCDRQLPAPQTRRSPPGEGLLFFPLALPARTKRFWRRCSQCVGISWRSQVR